MTQHSAGADDQVIHPRSDGVDIGRTDEGEPSPRGLNFCSGRLQDNSEQTFFVETPQIGT